MPKLEMPALETITLQGAAALSILGNALTLREYNLALASGNKEIAFVQLVMTLLVVWQTDTLPADKDDMPACVGMVEEIIELNWKATAKALRDLDEADQ